MLSFFLSLFSIHRRHVANHHRLRLPAWRNHRKVRVIQLRPPPIAMKEHQENILYFSTQRSLALRTLESKVHLRTHMGARDIPCSFERATPTRGCLHLHRTIEFFSSFFHTLSRREKLSIINSLSFSSNTHHPPPISRMAARTCTLERSVAT